MKSLSIVAILLLFTQVALAQRFQRTDSLKYGDQVALWLSQSSDTTSTRIGRQFANLWYGPKLSDTQKATIQAITAKMMAKNYNLHPYVTRFTKPCSGPTTTPTSRLKTWTTCWR